MRFPVDQLRLDAGDARRIVNACTLALLPPGAIVANTARGDIVDDEALIAALSSDRLAAAGIHVFKGEPAIDPRYRTLDNVFLLPHMAAPRPDAQRHGASASTTSFNSLAANAPPTF